MSSELNLHMYEYGECEWAIAASPEDAMALFAISEGCQDPELLEKLPADKVIGFWCGEDGKPCEQNTGAVRRVACSEWVALLGRGYVGTTEA